MEENDDSSVNFLFRTMLTRDPRKRQVKPVQHGMLMDFPELDDSEDDDDYALPSGKGGTSDEDGGGSDDEESDDEAEGSEDQSDDVTEQVGDNEEIDLTIGDLVDLTKKGDRPASALSEPTVDTVLSVSSVEAKPIRVLICAVCLLDYSEANDEMVECDGCGVAVHEACYGITDSLSIASTESSASTEPWFCDACKANVMPSCELCPNTGGIFKETDAGRWVHLVCALYVPGVAFGDIDLLTSVTLFEMPYSKWGAKECSLCVDMRFSRTGVCVGCDAGMCRSNFHVTCAQREGLLFENSADVEIADPFFAHCKQHAEKLAMKIKRRNFLALKSRVKAFKDKQNSLVVDEKERITRKLKRHRRKYSEMKNNRPANWVPETKMPRLLTTSASAMRRLMKKAELLGVTSQTQEAEAQLDIRRKRHHALAFSADFIRYYFDRGERIEECRVQLKQLEAQKHQLDRQEAQLRVRYDQLTRSVKALRSHYQKNLTCGAALWNAVSAASKKKLRRPSYLEGAQVKAETSHATPSPTRLHSIIHTCAKCSGSRDQHLLAHCDTCHKHYHLGCLDPPLTRMPKKTKLYGWQCSECMSSSGSDSSEAAVNIEAPMRLRQTIKEPHKFRPQEIHDSKRKKLKRKRKPTPKKAASEASEGKAEEVAVKKSRKSTTPKRAPPEITRCRVCDRESMPSQLVKCDDCCKHYHFICLDPPRKTTPRVRGYAWKCASCSPSESEDEDNEDDVTVID